MNRPFSIPSLSRLSSLQLFQMFRYGAIFLNSIFIAQLVHSREVIGQYETVVLIGSSFTFFWVSGIINSFIPYYAAAAEQVKRVLIFNVFILLSGISLACILLLWLFVPFFVQPDIGMFRYYLLFTLFNAPGFLTEYIFMVHHRNRRLLAYGMLSSAFQILAIALPLVLHVSLQDALGWLAFFGLLKYVYLVYLVQQSSDLELSGDLLKAFFNRSWPLMLSLLLGGSMAYIDSYMVLNYSNRTAFAIYQYGAREMPLALLVANALSNVASGEIARFQLQNSLKEGLHYIRKRSLKLMHFLFPVTWVLLFTSPYLFERFYGKGFTGAALIFNIFLLQVINRLIFPQTVMLGLQRNRNLMYISGIEWVCNLLLNLLGLYWLGVPGVAYATILSFCLENALQVMYLKRRHIAFSEYVPVLPWLAYSVVTIGIFALVSFFIPG